MRRRLILSAAFPTLLALALVAVGCGADSPVSVSPSVVRLDDPSAAAASPDALAGFEARLRDATTREGGLVRAVAGASADADMRDAVAQMRHWVDGERTWLADHPADPCFDAAATKFQAALDAMTASADEFEALMEVAATIAPSDDVTVPSMGALAGQSLQDAAQALADAAALAKTARTSCR